MAVWYRRLSRRRSPVPGAAGVATGAGITIATGYGFGTYSHGGDNIQCSGRKPSGDAASSGFPSTGSQLVLIAGVGIDLVVLGIVLRTGRGKRP